MLHQTIFTICHLVHFQKQSTFHHTDTKWRGAMGALPLDFFQYFLTLLTYDIATCESSSSLNPINKNQLNQSYRFYSIWSRAILPVKLSPLRSLLIASIHVSCLPLPLKTYNLQIVTFPHFHVYRPPWYITKLLNESFSFYLLWCQI